MTSRRQLLKTLAAAPAAALATPWTAAFAQGEYPSRPIKLVVPFAAGSTPDVFARIVAERAAVGLKQPVIVDNRPGAGGNLGTDVVAKAAPDGYTIGASITGPLVNNVVLYKKMPYDPFKDLAPITFGVNQANVLAVTPSLGVNTLQELMDLLRKNPGKYNYASIGVGSLSHLSMEMLKTLTHSFVVHVPYPSSPAAVTSVIMGDTQMVSLAPLAVVPQVKAGKLKALAVSTTRRVPQLPDVPTFREAGLPMDGSAWIGLVAPAATPAPIIERLNHEFVAAMRDPGVNEKLKAQYMEADPGTPAQFAAFMKAELAKWGPVIKRSGATID
jgi:tripartite-type tricarboxylate transporter receptor subunit TctC